jgi:two-component system sensor histidine kinase/response regulator
MGRHPVRVLLIEDSESDYLLTRRMLSSIENQIFNLEWARSWQTGIEAIRRGAHDVCLLDYRIDGGDGLELLKESRETSRNTPVILLTGVSDYRLDVEAMQLGAADFLVKDQITPALLERSIRHAMEQGRTLDELRRQQDELQASELRFRSVVQSASDAIILADDHARIIFWNRGAEAIFGYREDEIVERSIELLIPENYREKHRAGFERFRTRGRSQLVGKTVELEGLRKDGTVFPIELSLASWTNGEGTFFTGIVRDITERKRTEEMRRAKETAEEASRAKSNFVARISHELRTPLHAIIGFTNLLLQNKEGNLTPADIDFLDRILVNAQHQLQLINTILDLSKVEAGRLEVNIGLTSVDSLVRDVVKQFESECLKQNVRIEVRIPETVKPIVTDASKLKQVLINLIDNALKFTEEGQVTVEVTVSPIDFQPIRIDVTDTGVGIPSDRLEDIFEPFLQLQPGATSRSGGTGLGLSICRSICDLLDYRLQVESTPGKGSTFSVVLAADEALSLWKKVG